MSKKLFVHHYFGDISEKYQLGPRLGDGGFAFVRKAKVRDTGAKRAIKTIRKSRLYQANVELFFREIETLKTVDHPHIVKIYEVIEDEKNYHIVTELLTGGELFDFITEGSNVITE